MEENSRILVRPLLTAQTRTTQRYLLNKAQTITFVQNSTENRIILFRDYVAQFHLNLIKKKIPINDVLKKFSNHQNYINHVVPCTMTTKKKTFFMSL